MITRAQAVEFFYAPSPWETSPDAEEAGRRSHEWAKRTGLIRTQETVDTVASWNLGVASSCVFPRARGEGLDVMSDWAIWGLVYDDLCGSIGLSMTDLATIVNQTLTVAHCDPIGPPPHPLRGADAAVWDILTRTASRMSSSWTHRWSEHIGNYLQGLMSKAFLVRSGQLPDVETALAVRADDIGIWMYVDFVEYAEGFELPPIAVHTSGYREMYRCLSQGVAIQNDILSYWRDTEDGRDRTTSIVFALQRRDNKGLENALMEARALYKTHITELEAACDRFTGQCRSLGFTGEDIKNAETYTRNVFDALHGNFYAHMAAAARGYLGSPSAVPRRSELLTDNTTDD